VERLFSRRRGGGNVKIGFIDFQVYRHAEWGYQATDVKVSAVFNLISGPSERESCSWKNAASPVQTI
jgi:hypothetical protein